jgi:succinyl-diaminopimelate desuccinylase
MGCAEETGMADIRHFAKAAPLPVLSLIPDSMFPANYAQKGSLQGLFGVALGKDIVEFSGGEVFNMVPPGATALLKGISLANPPEGVEVSEEDGLTRVRARGVASHAARPEAGVSAIHLLAAALLDSGLLTDQSARAMAAVKALSADIHGEASGIAAEDPDTGRTTMVVGLARTEDGNLSFSVDCRLSLNGDGARDMEALHRFARGLGLVPREFRTTAPVYMPKGDPRVEALQRAYFDATGDPAEPYTTGGGTYARWLPNAITFGISFPGEHPRPEGLPEGHGDVHAPDEYLHIPSLVRAAEVYAHAILTLDPSICKEDT